MPIFLDFIGMCVQFAWVYVHLHETFLGLGSFVLALVCLLWPWFVCLGLGLFVLALAGSENRATTFA
jgi:hypothetical protein